MVHVGGLLGDCKDTDAQRHGHHPTRRRRGCLPRIAGVPVMRTRRQLRVQLVKLDGVQCLWLADSYHYRNYGRFRGRHRLPSVARVPIMHGKC